MTRQVESGRPEPVAALLRRLRLARRLSQLQVAEMLCEVSGRPTVSRHELSRWERGERVPGPLWLGWLAVVLEAPLEELEAAVTVTRGQLSARGARPADQLWLWRPVVAVDLLAALDHGNVHDVRGLAHAWLAGPPDGWNGGGGPVSSGIGLPSPGRRTATAASRKEPEPALPDGSGRDVLGLLEARLARLRRADDLLGGIDLAGRVDRRLREVIPVLKVGSGSGRNGSRSYEPRTQALRLIAGYAQLAGWVHADGGNAMAARRAYRVGLRAATVGEDRKLAAHVLGSLSCLSLDSGNAQEALLLARSGLAGLNGAGGERAGGSALLRALLLHRAALAAARMGEKREAEVALVEAERVVDRSMREEEPEWLYWLDPEELTAMTGRCLAVLGRHLRAVRLLTRQRGGGGRRGSALYGCWLARCYVALGEVEEASRVVARVRVDAVEAGSRRAGDALRYLGVVGAAERSLESRGLVGESGKLLGLPTLAASPLHQQIPNANPQPG